MAWKNEVVLPFTIYSQLFFSPIVTVSGDSIVYLIDKGKTNFWKYNLDTGIYTQLSNVGYVVATGASGHGNINRSLAVSPDGTKLACVSDATNNHRGGKRIEVFTIATNAWAASSQVQNMDDEGPTSRATAFNGLIWADEDTIWAWAHEASTGTLNYARCIKYTISTDTFTIGATLLNGGLTFAEGRVCAINAAGTIIYGGMIGSSSRQWYKYTISGDSYASGGTLTSGRAFAFATDDDKLWYYNATDIQQGYVATSDDSENDDKFPENTDRSGSQGNYFGSSDDVDQIIAYALSTTPFVMSASGLLVGSAVTTQPVSAIANTTATGNGTIVDTGLSAVTAHGHVVDTTIDPKTTADGGSPVVEVDNGAGSLGVFTSSITGLSLGQTYYTRAYATNTEGTVYGANVAWISGHGIQLIEGNLAIVETQIHYVDADGKERYLEGTLV